MFFSLSQARHFGVLVLGMGLGAVLTFVLTKHSSSMVNAPHATPPALAAASPKALYWYDPMQPTQHFDQPGKSPFMDMQLVPKYADPGTTDDASVAGISVDSKMVQNLGMRKTKVVRTSIGAQQDLPGTLRFNERNQAVIQLRAAGFVEKAWPLAPGDHVSAGQPIATFYVPEWLDAQNELIAQTLTNSPRLLQTLRTRLLLLGMPDSLIAQVEKTRKPETRVTITAPISGVIESLDIKTGMSLMSGQTLARINGVDTLWLDVAIPEAEAAGLHPGDAATFYAANAKAKPLSGKIDSLLPALNDATRTVTARVLVPNPGGALKPGTSGRVVLSGSNTDNGLLVPTEAVIRTGKRTLVMVVDTENHFRPVMVTLGSELGDQTVITAGLEEGEEVVVSGQFLLDSEASLMGLQPEEPVEMQP